MELEEAIKTLENFKNNKLEHDKLEIRNHGGFKIGDIYKFTELNPATETVLNHLTKKDKMIELMARFIDTELSSEHLSKVLKIDVKPLETYREDIKQYFENKAEEIE